MNCDGIIDDEFSVEEIEAALKKLKLGKASGIDGLQSEHLKLGGSLLVLWLKQIINVFSQFEHVSSQILTGIIKPIYKGNGKYPLCCNSYRDISITSVFLKLFEYTLLERILPVLQENGHPALTQTAYKKGVSCQEAIFSTQEAIISILRDANTAFLFLYELEKAFDSIEHPVLLHSLFHVGISGRSWKLFRAWYSNLSALVRFKSVMSPSIPIHRGVQQGSVLSPTFFLVVMDKLLLQLSGERCGISICGLYLGGAAHADSYNYCFLCRNCRSSGRCNFRVRS